MPIAAKATQEFIPIKSIDDGIITLKDGSLRAVILASSVNFALKSEDERAAIISQFQDFLNSLDFSTQIVIQSRELDIRPYIALLGQRERAQTNDLMRIQIREYIGFIKHFTENSDIMTKRFFIVVPYAPRGVQIKKDGFGFFSRNKKNDQEKKSGEQEVFEERRTQLEQRIAVIEQGLVRSGVRVARLGTEEVIELFYKTFNPGETEKAIKIS